MILEPKPPVDETPLDDDEAEKAAKAKARYCCEIGHPEPAPCPHDEGQEHGGEA